MERCLAEAIHENMVRALRRVGSVGEGARSARVGPWLLMDGGAEFVNFDVAIPVAGSADPSASVKQAAAWFGASGRRFRMFLREGADAPLVDAALRLGLTQTDSEPAMTLYPLPEPANVPGPLLIREGRSDADALLFSRAWPDGEEPRRVALAIARTARELTDFTFLIGTLDGCPVATSVAVVTGDVVGVYSVEVNREYRRRGIGAAMTLAAVDVGRRSGASIACLQSTRMGYSVYRRLGFETVDTYLEFRPE
jgi:GNAT superfamily N-acetyltransferase